MMEKERLFTIGYGPDKNGCTTYLAKEINCIINEWRGDVLPDEINSVGALILNKIAKYKPEKLVEDFRFLTSAPEEVNKYFGETFIPGALKLGVKKNAVVVSDNPAGSVIAEGLMRKSTDVSKNDLTGCLQFFFTTDLPKAVQWIKR